MPIVERLVVRTLEAGAGQAKYLDEVASFGRYDFPRQLRAIGNAARCGKVPAGGDGADQGVHVLDIRGRRRASIAVSVERRIGRPTCAASNARLRPTMLGGSSTSGPWLLAFHTR